MENEFDYFGRLKWLDDVCITYDKGKQIYDSLVQILNENSETEVIVSPANLGDTVFIASLSEAYKKTHGIKNLIIVAKERQAEAVEWFAGVDGTVGLDDYEMATLRYYFTISRKFYGNRIRYGHIPCYIDAQWPNTFIHIPPGFGGMPLIDVWKCRILDLPKNAMTSDIQIPVETGLPNCSEKYRNAVLIAPAAFTNKGIPESFWEKLVGKLAEMDLKVYCNSGGLSYDKNIEGTEALLMNTKELIVNAPCFKHVFAVRSGFTDLVAKTDARLSVLHLGDVPEGSLAVEYGTRGDDVRDLGRKDGIFPFVYVKDREDELIDLMLNDIC